jgi:hypothetical protein
MLLVLWLMAQQQLLPVLHKPGPGCTGCTCMRMPHDSVTPIAVCPGLLLQAGLADCCLKAYST